MTNYTANNTNTTTTANTTTTISVADGRKWNLILDAVDSYEITNATLLESIVNLIIANTCIRSNVDERYLVNITNSLKEMSTKCGQLTVRINNKTEDLDFSKFSREYATLEITRNLIKLLSIISENGIWYEDTYGGVGFCCRGNGDDDMIIVTMESDNNGEDEFI